MMMTTIIPTVETIVLLLLTAAISFAIGNLLGAMDRNDDKDDLIRELAAHMRNQEKVIEDLKALLDRLEVKQDE